MKELIYYLASNLANKPGEVQVTETRNENGELEITLKVHPDDLSQLIGKNGRTVKALRSLLSTASLKSGQKTNLKLLDERTV
jgi:predicted RNA-binding protein YlqC (UPF0109 family)